MRFEFDPDKNEKNLEQHGIDFETAQKLWDGSHVIIPTKYVLGESRCAILGQINNKVYIGIFTERREVVRLISCHRADKRWERIFYEYIEKKEKDN